MAVENKCGFNAFGGKFSRKLRTVPQITFHIRTHVGGRSLNLGERIERTLCNVQKPTRYLGGEWNAPTRPWEETDLHIALAFPDVYEIGQSHLGLRILYGLINEIPGFSAERVFAPWPDMEAEMRRESIPLSRWNPGDRQRTLTSLVSRSSMN